jgi:hypothetical protein
MLYATTILWLVSLLVGCAGSGRGARLTSANPQGGIVVYSFQDDGDLLTTAERKAAIGLISERCPAGYQLSREGEVSKVSHGADKAWSGQIGSDRKWAIEFRCK